MNLSLLSVEGISHREVLVSDPRLNGFVSDFRVGRPNKLPPCLVFEVMDPIGSLKLASVLHFPYPYPHPHPPAAQAAADPDEYTCWLANDPLLPPPGIFEIGFDGTG
jgi:hypothetical protein